MNQLNSLGTPKSKARLESEIEKCREEGNWQKVLQLASQLVQNTAEKCLVQFLLGESKLELYLEICNTSTNGTAATSSNTSTTVNLYSGENKDKLLDEAEEHFLNCLTINSSSPLSIDSNLLLAKLYFVRQQFDRSMKSIEKSGIDSVTQIEKTLPLRVMKLVAESFAIKGMSLENLAIQLTPEHNQNIANGSDSGTNSNDISPNASQVLASNNAIESPIFCLVRSSDLTLRYLQNVEKQLGQYSLNSVGSILETAIQRAPLLYIKNGQLHQAANQYRSILNAVECKTTQNCRQVIARQLSEMIMRNVTRCQWSPLDPSIQNNSGPWKPHRYTGQSLFQPAQREEELLLLLLIAEQQAAANVVLERSAEFASACRDSINNVIAIYDLFSIAFTPHRHFATDLFEKAMKFSFEQRHVWLQFALSLHQTNRNALRCVRLFEECHRLQPEDPLALLFQSKIHLQQLTDPEVALQYAEDALQLVQQSNSTAVQPLLSRCYLLIGVCSAILYEQQSELLRPQQRTLLQKSMHAFSQMAHCNPQDPLPHFHLALHLCKQQEISQAVAHLQLSLALHPGHLQTIHLLLICLSALQKHREAHALCESALLEFPGQLLLLFIKAHLETQLSEDGEQQALLTAKEMLRCCRKLTNAVISTDSVTNTVSGIIGGAGNVESGSRIMSAQNSSYYLTGVNCDTISLRLEQTLGEAACIDSSSPLLSSQLVSELSEPNMGGLHHSQSSAALVSSAGINATAANASISGGSINIPFSASSLQGRHANAINAQLGAMQMQVWLMVAELFIRLGQLGEAEQCLAEHVQSPFGCLSHQLLYVRGRLFLARQQPAEAKMLLQNAISINPRHAPALQQLGLTYHMLGNHQTADKYLRDSLNCDSSCVQTWSIMGDVLDALNDHERAVNCHLTALRLEQTQPVLPFSIVPRLVLD